MERRPLGIAIDQSGLAAAPTAQLVAGIVEQDDLMMTGIGHQPLAISGRFDLAGEQQLLVGKARLGQEGLSGVDGSVLAELAEHLGDTGHQGFGAGFARGLADDPAIGRDEDHGRPSPHRIILPDRHIGIMDHGMADVVALYCLFHIGGLALGGEFG